MSPEIALEESWGDIRPTPATSTPDADNERPQRISQAAQAYFRRKSRREHPEGQFDSAQRWYPSEDERQTCCGKIRHPSRSYPYSYMVHCRTVEHVARLYNVTPEELRAAIKPPKVKTPNPNRRLRGPTVWDKITNEEPSSELSSLPSS